MTDEPLEEGAQRVALWDETDSEYCIRFTLT